MYQNNFQFKSLFLDKATVIASVKKINVALLVVKKLPVLFIGNTSTKKRNMNGIIILLNFRSEKKYFFIKEIYKAFENIINRIKNPIKPKSVNISK